jgi:hypothetical protein
MAKHVVVDGSNIATEGRAMPSLKQLNDAVMAYIQEHPEDLVTVVVDATFGHRIEPSEVPEFDAAVENNELVSPPAGAIGRGDAFVLTIANKANATVLSNDSFQEFHGQYPWLFDEGRLIGGKPVPHVGWVFVPRAPVRGPVSRRAVRERAKASTRPSGRPSKLASEPLPAPKLPPPGRTPPKSAVEPRPAEPAPVKATHAPSTSKQAPINGLLPFLTFVERHPIGTTVQGTAESYSSHGAYVRVDDVRAYVPLRFLADPPPRSARDVLALGDAASFIVVRFNAPRRGVDLAAPGLAPPEVVALAPVTPEPVKKAAKRVRKAPAAVEEPVPAPTPVKRTRKKAAAVAEPPAPVTPEPVKKAVKRVRKAPAAVEEPVPAPTPVKRTRKKSVAVTSADGTADVAADTPPVKKAAKRATKATKKTAAVS